MKAVNVVFASNTMPSTWSKKYLYECEIDVSVGALVVVPTGHWYSVGQVLEVSDDLTLFEGNKRYKKIMCKLQLPD